MQTYLVLALAEFSKISLETVICTEAYNLIALFSFRITLQDRRFMKISKLASSLDTVIVCCISTGSS
jgi:hypothetical protein